MRILHLLSSTGYHGAENMAAELIRQLTAFGIKCHVGVFYNNENSNKHIINVVDDCIEDGVIFLCAGKIDVRTIFLLRKYIRENSIDIIHSHKYKTNLYSLLATFWTNCKLVSTCHNWLGESINMRFYAGLDKFVLRGFDTVVGVSNEVVSQLKDHIASRKVKRIENGIDLRKYFRVQEKSEAKRILGLENKAVIGFVGRLSEDKGVSCLLEAVYKLVDQGKDIYTLIVGDGEYAEKIKADAYSMGITDRVIFTGNRSDTPLIYSALDVFVLPSLKEAFPMVILEAMACGAPVVATRVGDIPQIIENNISGLLIEPKDVDGLSRSIEELLSDSDKAVQITKSAHQIVQDKFSSKIMAGKYQAIYKHLLN